ncbi:cystatin-A3-like [Styela clava]|uniref:cystatin-A3-like n=1 Tax=Styela clava TaxID=7725 RepID=UPI001939CE93|nr:cystatin-A3-like [Styela clava]
MKLVILLAFVALAFAQKISIPGGVSERRHIVETDDEVYLLTSALRDTVEKQNGVKYQKFKPESYKYQVVNGFMYWVKVKVGRGEYIWVKFHVPIAATHPSLSAVALHKNVEDEIEPF